ncbi:MAG: LysR family transcriptional regulator [Aestuariivirga sp.]
MKRREWKRQLDWSLVHALHATAEKGSLSAAARALGLTQPTLSRQVAALEAQLGVTLFERVGKRLVPTETCGDLLVHVRAMNEAAGALALAATGRAVETAGNVSISASDVYAAYMLPGILSVIRKARPEITVTIVASNALSDIRRREADIAIRHVRPREPELIGKLLYETEANFYASKKWVARHGAPKTASELAKAEWLGFEDTSQYAAHLQRRGFPVTVDQFRIISANSIVLWEILKRGLGVGAMLKEIAELTPGVVRLLPDMPPVEVPVWLVTHRELRTSPRIRAVFDVLATHLSAG